MPSSSYKLLCWIWKQISWNKQNQLSSTVKPKINRPVAAAPRHQQESPKTLHLVSDPGFFFNYVVNLLTMVMVLKICCSVSSVKEVVADVYFQINEWMMATAHMFAWWSLLGLLASSCCALQLLLNAFSLGCAGFNTVLGPIRPTSLAITTLVQASSWYVAWNRPWQWKPTIISSVVVISLAFFPEVLFWYTTSAARRRKQKKLEGSRYGKENIGISPRENSKMTTNLYRLNNVGCSACVKTISGVLDKIELVHNYNISLDDGGILSVDTKNDASDDNGMTIRTKLEEAGFPIQPLDECPYSPLTSKPNSKNGPKF